MGSNVRTGKEKVIEQLCEGHELATQLRLLISKPFDDQGRDDPIRIPCGSDSGSAEELLAKILRSFDKALLTLNSFQPVTVPLPSAVEGSRNTSCQDSVALEFYDRRYEDSGYSRKRLGLNKGKRGCYKRKRKSQTWIVESATVEDAHAWRKYGQKDILNEKYPRSYFRCTHKYTHGCNATRQVQKLDDNPTIFQITYIGSHTCAVNNLINENSTTIEPAVSDIIMDTNNGTWSTSYINKENITTVKCSKVKEEEDNSTSVNVKGEETNGGDVVDGHQDLSLVWNEFMVFEETEMMYCSGETSSRGLDMDFMVLGSHNFQFGELSF